MVQFYRAYVAQFELARLSNRFHWEFVVRVSKTPGQSGKLKSMGTVYHVIGGVGIKWHFERKDNVQYSAPLPWAGCYHVGEVPADSLDDIARLAATIHLPHGDLKWNCQDWVWELLLLLRENGYNKLVLPDNRWVMKDCMQRAYNKWNDADDSD